MNLTIISLKKFFRSEDGSYWSYGGFGEYINSLIPYFNKITLCVPVGGERQSGAYQLDPGKVKIVELPFYTNELKLMVRLPIIFWRMRKCIKVCDVANPRIPDMTGVCGWMWAKWYKKPMFISMTSDIGELVKQPDFTSQKGLIKLGLLLWLRIYLFFEKLIVRNDLSFAQGDKLYQQYKRHKSVRSWLSSAIYSDQIVSKEQVVNKDNNNNPIRLLHVGRVTRAKGHYRLIEVLQELNLIGKRKYKLYCIGKQEEKLLDQLIAKAKTAHVEDQIEWVGNVSRGQPLFEYFDKCDVFVFTSLWEGTPKVILEALGRGLPVVTVNAGGISSVIEDGVTGLLLPKFDAKIMAGRIERLIDDNALRMKIVSNGLSVAEGNSVEAQARKIITGLIERYPALASNMGVK